MRSRKAQCQAPPDKTGKPEIHGQQRKTKLRWPENSTRYRAPKRTQAAQQQQQCEYIHTCVHKRGRFPQTRDLWRKSASMGYRVGRVSLHAVSRWLRSPGCCGYTSWCVFSVWWDFVFFFVFFTSNAHGRQQVRRNLSTGMCPTLENPVAITPLEQQLLADHALVVTVASGLAALLRS